MNSEEYEDVVASLIKNEIRDGKQGFDPNASNVVQKPKYYSRDRERDITFDVSVELTRTNEESPFLYWVIECKHYNHNVPVDDAEEFFAKLQQIGGANSKGTIVTKTGFSTGTVAFCRSKGIGLWRYNPGGEIVYVVQADSLRDRAILSGLTECDFNPRFFGLATSGYLSNNEGNIIACELDDHLITHSNDSHGDG